MKPILYDSSETKFINEGLGRLSDAISCTVTEERNGAYELEMEYPVDGIHFFDISPSRIISAVPADGKARQPFDIYKISKPINGRVTINARHISYRLSNIITKPGSASSCAAALELLRDNAIGSCPFDFWTDKDTIEKYSCDVPASIRSRLGGSDNSVLETYGGEYEWDGFTVKLHNHRGSDNGVRIAYGKNLTDVKQEESIESTVTGIYPYWYKAATDTEAEQLIVLDAPVYSSNADKYPYKMLMALDCTQQWQDAPSTSQLREYAESYIKNNNVGVPSVNIDVSFVALWQTEEYKDIAPLERLNLCDTATVEFSKLGVSATAKVIKTEYNVLLDRYDSITLGDAKSTLADTISSTTGKIDKAAEESRTFFERAIEHATALISGGLGGHVVFNLNADGKPNEILIMDTEDKNTAVNVIRENVAGIGFSTTGYNGPFRTAWTIDGHFNADFIDTGTLNANLIRTGLLTDQKGYNYWDLEASEFRLKSYMTTDDTNKAISDAKTEANQYTDNSWESNYTVTSVFNKLTDNGKYKGIFMQDGQLYVNADYILTGILTDGKGYNHWNLADGDFSVKGKSSSDAIVMQDGALSIDASQMTVKGLTVGDNVTMGSNAVISWTSVTGRPDSLSDFTNDTGYVTRIDAKSIATSAISAASISAGQINSGTMSASRISGGTLSGVTIGGVTINGAIIKTDKLLIIGYNNDTNTSAIRLCHDIDHNSNTNKYADILAGGDGVVVAINNGTFRVANGTNSEYRDIIARNVYLLGSTNRKAINSTTDAAQGVKDLLVVNKTTGGKYLAVNVNNGTGYGVDLYSSDQRLKTGIKDTDVNNALDCIDRIEHRQFNWKDSEIHVDNGYVADELQKIIPEAVFEIPQGEDSKYKSIKNISVSGLIPYITKAIQELSTKVDSLENRIAELEGGKNGANNN